MQMKVPPQLKRVLQGSPQWILEGTELLRFSIFRRGEQVHIRSAPLGEDFLNYL